MATGFHVFLNCVFRPFCVVERHFVAACEGGDGALETGCSLESGQKFESRQDSGSDWEYIGDG